MDLLRVREMAYRLQGLISTFFKFILKTAIKYLTLKIGKKPVFHSGKCGSKSRCKLHVGIGFSSTNGSKTLKWENMCVTDVVLWLGSQKVGKSRID
jgi:hypothetical protein